jgi:hypothetical protein
MIQTYTVTVVYCSLLCCAQLVVLFIALLRTVGSTVHCSVAHSWQCYSLFCCAQLAVFFTALLRTVGSNFYWSVAHSWQYCSLFCCAQLAIQYTPSVLKHRNTFMMTKLIQY